MKDENRKAKFSEYPQKSIFLIGTSGWSYPDWPEVFYPQGLPQRRWLEYYATVFPTVEINATFYRFFYAADNALYLRKLLES